ncbi:TPA: hypothetical protein ACOQ31_005386 [Bacillus cereus]|uniref:hypothetical protein n=1 Tax=Bacillus cereus group TaxID=86661 RepID=UPI0000E89FA5|nr:MULTISPECIES: hypothetical protein [Bacillus cereus group]ABK88204.1 hypothetical protein BALH_p0047 [Bacillus thuringiensis str. Al Hakam]AJH66322.1 hypothetical protein BF32_5441 [Bacillus thuringiensis]MCC2347161.1 hypothetical protein [Bacillus anthracis]QKH33337.1 hypothetical protein FOC87_27090 [Bacillus thuringiensis]QKQ37796.1 hypothetical protein FOC85_00080 [Bacillus thuringiensis]
MAKYYGYCYDEEGRFTEMISLAEKEIYEKQTFYREETKEIVTEEKLCELHQSIENGTYKYQEDEEPPISKYDCPDCVQYYVRYETIKVPYEEDVVIGYEPDIPANCTLEVCPDGIYYPLFKDGKWVKTVEPKPEEPKPEEPSELEKIKKQLADIQKELEDIKNQKPPTLEEPEVPIAFAAPIQDTPDYEHEINKIKQVIPDLGEQIVDLNSRIADLENKEQV